LAALWCSDHLEARDVGQGPGLDQGASMSELLPLLPWVAGLLAAAAAVKMAGHD
jgi:hypothetical protein